MPLTHPTSITFAAYLLAMVAIGLVAARYTRTLSDYILGGRRLGGFVTAMSAGASDMSGWLLMGLPGAVYLAGFSEAWIAIGLVAGAWFNWYVVAGRLRVYTEHAGNALTLPDYFARRFEDGGRALRILSALVILVFFAVYCASGMVAGARLFEQTFGLDYGTALWAGAAATILYVFIGGFLAVSWTDAVQATLMLFALLLTPLLVLVELGGPGAAAAALGAARPGFVEGFFAVPLVTALSLVAWGLGYLGQPHILARFMAAQDLLALRRARRIGMGWMILCLAGAVLVGAFAAAWFAQHPNQAAPVAANSERVFVVLAQVLFNPWLAGVLLSAILAAVMSTLSCQLLVCASALTEDFYRALLRPSAGQRELVWFGRTMVLLVAVLAMVIAADPDSRVLGLVGYAWAGFGAAFGPVILLSLTWRDMTRNGALAGMLAGAATVIAWHNGHWYGLGEGPVLGLYEMVPGFFAGLAAAGIFSHLQGSPPTAVTERFDAVSLYVRD